MRIAFPIWEDKISPVLDTASRLMIVEEVDGVESSRFEIFMDEEDLSRRCLRIQGMAVDLLICGAISKPFLRMLRGYGITIIPEIAGQAENVLMAYFQGNLLDSDFLMPGCRGNRGRCLKGTKEGQRGHGTPCRFENRSKESNKRR